MNEKEYEQKIFEIAKKHLINSEREAEDAIEFVQELLELSAEYTESTEPWAFNGINNDRKAALRVSDLYHDIPEVIGEKWYEKRNGKRED